LKNEYRSRSLSGTFDALKVMNSKPTPTSISQP